MDAPTRSTGSAAQAVEDERCAFMAASVQGVCARTITSRARASPIPPF
jgi:hypothetical protein